jgi:hypothetical protein
MAAKKKPTKSKPNAEVFPGDLTEEEFTELKLTLGGALLNLPLASKLTRHATMIGTLRDYFVPTRGCDPRYKVTDVAAVYVHDLLTMCTDKMCAKYFKPDAHVEHTEEATRSYFESPKRKRAELSPR